MKLPEEFGCMVFNDRVMKERLPAEVYTALRKTIDNGRSLDITVASVVANEMKEWAIENGATHFTHWFQPMSGITAEKHDSFLSPGPEGQAIMDFSGRELIKGEPDASSFPSGGLRATFEARGYTAWDATSYAFIKNNTLCIPTAFCSYGGEALDKKTPLLRSMEAVGRQAMRVVRLFGNEDVHLVRSMVGPEQEYFLIDRKVFDRRRDLRYTGRTLFGAKPPKGQEMDDHYFGTIKPRVAAFMRDLDEELWKLGIYAKTEHNEAAPAQHELAIVYSTTNIATDHNQLTMELLKSIAARHDLVCLLHEKPFEGVNGSGKHNNWSLATDTGVNLLSPGETPHENAQFLLFLCAVIQAVDEYQDLLRISVSGAGNDHRLGGGEAPPAVVSIFLGEELTELLNAIEADKPYDPKAPVTMKVGVHTLPRFQKDSTDRNRTSPFAFTGNKFEFRMPGSSDSVASPNIVLNTAVADVLQRFADELEGAEDFQSALHALIQRTVREHKRIIFNGDGYHKSWIKEAEERGLLNLPATPDALPYLLKEKNVALFERHRVFTQKELCARYEVYNQIYCKTLNIEAQTMLKMARRDILPAILTYTGRLSQALAAKQASVPAASGRVEQALIERLSEGSGRLYDAIEKLDEDVARTSQFTDPSMLAFYFKETVIPAMNGVRAIADELELLTAKKYWPYPSCGDLLFSIG